MNSIFIYPSTYKKERRIILQYNYKVNDTLDQVVRLLPDRKYSNSCRFWHIPFRNDYKAYLKQYFASIPSLELVFGEADHTEESSRMHTESILNPAEKSVKIKIDEVHKKFYLDHGYEPVLFKKLNDLKEGIWLKKQKNWMFEGTNEKYLKIKKILIDSGYMIKREKVTFNNASGRPSISYITKKNAVIQQLKEEELECYDLYTKLITLKRLSPSTMDVYTYFFAVFLKAYEGQSIKELTYKDLFGYVKKQSDLLRETQLKQCIAAIKFYYEKGLGWQTLFFNIKKAEKVEAGIVHVNFNDISRILEDITPVADRMILFLYFHGNFSFKEISELPADELSLFCRTYRLPGQSEKSIQYFKTLYKEFSVKHPARTLLWEYNQEPYGEKNIELKLYRVMQHYNLSSIKILEFRLT